MSVEDWIKLIHTGGMDEYMRHGKLHKDPCPPYELIDDSIACFYCENCKSQCVDRVKVQKDHYKVGKKKYLKGDFDEGK